MTETSDRIMSSWELKKRMQESNEKPVLYPCGMPTVDHLLEGGFMEGELIAMSGATKNGKTTVMQSWTSGFERNGIHALWFAYEVPPKQLIRRWKNLPLFYFPETIKGRVLEYIQRKVREAKAEFDTKIVFIDHLHYLLDFAQLRNPSLQIGQLIRGLKLLAMQEQVVIFLACHTTKAGTPDAEPSSRDIRDSSFVAQESDGVFICWRNLHEENSTTLKFELHRRIGILDRKIPLTFSSGELREVADESETHWSSAPALAF